MLFMESSAWIYIRRALCNDIWLAIRKKGLSDICVKCRLGLACADSAG